MFINPVWKLMHFRQIFMHFARIFINSDGKLMHSSGIFINSRLSSINSLLRLFDFGRTLFENERLSVTGNSLLACEGQQNTERTRVLPFSFWSDMMFSVRVAARFFGASYAPTSLASVARIISSGNGGDARLSQPLRALRRHRSIATAFGMRWLQHRFQ